MRLPDTTDWPRTLAEARAVQEALRGRVLARDAFDRPECVAGVDVGFERDGRLARAAVVVLDFPALTVREQAVARTPVGFPYVPGYLSFREVPALLAALARLRRPPDLILCDGQGYAHPRRFGLACHLGVLLDIPTIGVAKSRLIGTPRGRLAAAKGSRVPLMDGDEVIGTVLRTRAGVKPLYVSIGHRVSLASAVALVLACCPRYRLPETTRRAHRLASGG
jgi:deoxyribonuclease V